MLLLNLSRDNKNTYLLHDNTKPSKYFLQNFFPTTSTQGNSLQLLLVAQGISA